MSAFSSAMSEHPVTASAVGEVTGQVLETLGARPDLAAVFVTAAHGGALEDVMATVEAVLHPLAAVGVAAEAVVGPHREVEGGAGVALFAGRTGPLLPLSLGATVVDRQLEVEGWPSSLSFVPELLLLFADPYSFPADDFLSWLEQRHPGLPVVGGLASAARGPGGNRLAVGTAVHTRGAVGVLLGPGAQLEAVVSQGCRPFGQPVVVTKAEGNVIYELAGRPALERLVSHASASLTGEEVEHLERGGLQLGRVIDEHRERFGAGDFLLRAVMGGDSRNGAIAVGDVVPVGTTVQFHLRDARAADQDLHDTLQGRDAQGALLFTCNGRGRRLFEAEDHDVGVLTRRVGRIPVAGFFAAGEIGPVGSQNFLHGFSASLALFR